MMFVASCHSDAAVADEESLIISGECVGRARHSVSAVVRFIQHDNRVRSSFLSPKEGRFLVRLLS